ncbi:hypothetical protein Y032_0550g3301 [Ancylostoma ceylanicum]|uniref:PAN-3 domain-containing protein n=1 Tax=Ancylostoma ceylanicum TaxID=53326 RepID=A0A016WQP0_9BILA|nr:hypothetical protein Y032_0550g3301 [Ancylostoma ceylanicum]
MKTLLFAATVLALNGALHACAFYKSSKEIDLGWRYAFENMPKDACLKTCYHDLGCTYVKHEQTSCYVFSNKNPTITVKDGYLIDRDTSVTSTASCSSTVSCAPPVTFQQLDKDPSVINGKCPDVTITSIYRHKYPYSSVYMYSRETVVRNWGRYTSSMLFFANKPEGLEFVPVFTHSDVPFFFTLSFSNLKIYFYKIDCVRTCV